ncbi:MAG: TetR/AcrR family transcriptional regulator [Chloroflexaceae bacterium]|nr:TetR/AcrR family transcriptional regulator [Chloroflexaceae bacterium]NJO05152.1 TetR/AcrR family transcriptional regulator [Chloroflexaceae bacterium]
MSDTPLTTEQILEKAEDVLRRYGPAKATVVDVARALQISHGSVYRHFPSKAALRDAVTRRWLERISTPLAAIAARHVPALERLRDWLHLLIHAKRHLAQEDPELFASYVKLSAEAREVIGEHVTTLVDQLSQIIADGVQEGVFETLSIPATARAVFDATARFHNPVHVQEWSDPTIDTAYANVWTLILRGLTPHT